MAAIRGNHIICQFSNSTGGTPSSLPLRRINVNILGLMQVFKINFFFFLRRSFALVTQVTGWSAKAPSRLTETSASWVQAILLPQPPEYLGLQARATVAS